uniref:Uncharacterized protein n=1 Tax=Timema shepardi TaxID=629360 RepID=A0A7R9B4F0_TIMSH|nr:unnamed protein product [Timema shepardi]
MAKQLALPVRSSAPKTLSDLSCRNTRQSVGSIYTRTNFVTLKYVTDGWGTESNGFKLVITAFKDKIKILFSCSDRLNDEGMLHTVQMRVEERVTSRVRKSHENWPLLLLSSVVSAALGPL